MATLPIGGVYLKLFLPIFSMNFPEIVDYRAAGRRRIP